jgi:hypothetical protein
MHAQSLRDSQERKRGRISNLLNAGFNALSAGLSGMAGGCADMV